MTQKQALKPVLVQHIYLEASPERVYQHLTQAHLLERWFPHKVSTDPRVGGQLSYEFLHGEKRHHIEGRYLELVPEQKVVYSWHESLEQARIQTNLTVTFRLEAKGSGTELYLEESGYRDDAAHLEHQGKRIQGWDFFFTNLKSLLEEGKDHRSH